MDRYIFQRPEKHRNHHEHQKPPNKTEIWFGKTYCLAFMKMPKEFNSSYRIGTKIELRIKDLLQYKIHKE